ncbi:MAG: hypothetical protein HC793_01630, partial [Aquincola sp.]|nr:hypothetical protein [Aquincola sp.]
MIIEAFLRGEPYTVSFAVDGHAAVEQATGVPLAVSAWLVAPGERVYEGDRVVEILAGEVTIDIGSPAAIRSMIPDEHWRFVDELDLPRAIIINRMDRENADFDRRVRHYASHARVLPLPFRATERMCQAIVIEPSPEPE